MRHRLDEISRRSVLMGAAAILVLPCTADSALATPETMVEAMDEVLGKGASIKRGRVKIELPELAENGNSVPLKLTVDSPMTAADHVKAVYVFSEKNPVSNVARFHLGPRSGVARNYPSTMRSPSHWRRKSPLAPNRPRRRSGRASPDGSWKSRSWSPRACPTRRSPAGW